MSVLARAPAQLLNMYAPEHTTWTKYLEDCSIYIEIGSMYESTGRNLGGNRLAQRSGTTSRGIAVLVFFLRMRRFILTLVLTIFVGMK